MRIFHAALFAFICFSATAQNVTYNHLVEPDDPNTQAVMKVFEGYIASQPDQTVPNGYWNAAGQNMGGHFDVLESEFQPSLYMGFPVHVLSLSADANGDFEIKAQFSYCKEDGTPNVLAIVNYHARLENGTYRLANALFENRTAWEETTVGLVRYFYPTYHTFDFDKAHKLNGFIRDLADQFEIEPIPFEYYLADTYDEIQALKGIDYYLGMGGNPLPSGKSSHGRVYCAGLGEYYPHEVFHVQVDPAYPNKHFWVSEGVATFLGGSRGQSLDWHLERTRAYLENHPEIDLSNMLSLSNLDARTAYHYALGGLVVKLIYEKGGWTDVKTLMRSGTTDADYYRAIETLLNVKRSDLDAYLRNALADYK